MVSERPTRLSWALRQVQQIVRSIAVRLSLEVLAPIVHCDDHLNRAVIDVHEVIDQVSFDVPDRVIFEMSPPDAVLNSADRLDALMRIVVTAALVDAHNL